MSAVVAEAPVPAGPPGAADALLLPPGTRLLHIGPHKTGTTTVQYAFHAARPQVAAHGVFYPGPNSQPMFAVYAVTGRMPDYVLKAPIERWDNLVRSVDEAGAKRTVISSEGLCDADDAAVERIVRDMGGSRVHVVVTLRPLPDLLASQWQQRVQDGTTQAYEEYLTTLFRDPSARAAQGFWHRHRHDQLVERWARVVGPDRLSVVVVDDRDHDAILRTFEAFVGLPTGILRSQRQRTNRSLTSPEIELVRALNLAFRDEDMDPDLRVRLVRDGVAELLRGRDPLEHEPRITTPGWARERAAATSLEIVAGIEASGVRVIGELERLTAPTRRPRAAGANRGGELTFAQSAEIAAAGPIGMLLMTGRARRASGAAKVHRLDEATVSTFQIRRALVGRARRTVQHRLPAVVPVVRVARRVRRAVRTRLSGDAGAARESAPQETAGSTTPPNERALRVQGPPEPRPLTLPEAEVLRAYELASERLGIGTRDHDRLVRGAIERLWQRTPATGEPQAGAELDPGTVAQVMSETAWAEIGAAAAVGVLDATGFMETPSTRRIESLDTARIPNTELARIVLRRAARRMASRRPADGESVDSDPKMQPQR